MEKVLSHSCGNQQATILMTRTVEETRQIGRLLGEGLAGGEVIALTGDLGSGKTSFVQGLASGLGISPTEITSPTFTIIHEHRGRLPLAHVDLYRLESLEAIEALGLIDYFGEEGVTVIEWAERATPLLPFNVLRIRFAFRSSAERELRFEGTMGHYQGLIDSLVARYKGYSRGGSDD